MKREIFIKTSFAALHNWPACPFEEVRYLRRLHRHIFHVQAWFPVHHNNRDLEFIKVKQDINLWIRNKWEDQELIGISCEMMAEALMNNFGCSKVTVSEDNENGATIEK